MQPLYKDNENLKNQLNFNFLTNKVKGLQSTKKRLKRFNILKNNIGPKGILLLHEIHSSVETKMKWIEDFKDKIYLKQQIDGSDYLLSPYKLHNVNTEREQLTSIKYLNIKWNETCNLCDTWFIILIFTFQQRHFTGIIQQRF